MPVESATYISDLNSSNPAASDAVSQGDDHLRLIKSTVKATFPSVTGAVTRSHAEINMPIGVGLVMASAVSPPPMGWLECDGSAVSRATYALLFAALGTYYGAGDGSTTFNLPDLRARTIYGRDPGESSGRIANAVCGLDIGTLGAGGGAEGFTLVTGNIPAHTHSIAQHSHTYSGSNTTSTESVAHAHTQGSLANSNTNLNHVHTYEKPTSSVSVLTGAGASVWQASLSATDTSSSLGDHTHNISGATDAESALHTHTLAWSGTTSTDGATATGSTGSGNAVGLVSPGISLLWVIFTGNAVA